MPIYKVLYLDDRRQKAFSGLVRTDDDERWDSPIAALNDLGSKGWELQTLIYGPAPSGHPGDQFVEALLLVNKSATPRADIERRIERTKAEIASAQGRLVGMKGGMDATLLSQHIRELSSHLAEFESKLLDATGPSK